MRGFVDTTRSGKRELRSHGKGFYRWDQFHAGSLCALELAQWQRAPRLNRLCLNRRFSQHRQRRRENRSASFRSGPGFADAICCARAKKVPSGVCVGTADLYDMHRKAGVEAYGSDVPTTKDYRESAGSQRCGRGDCRGCRFSASARGAGLCGGGQRCLLREADVAQRGRRTGDGEGRASGQAHLSGGQPAGEQYGCTRKPRRFIKSGRLGAVTLIEGSYGSQFAIRRMGVSSCAGCERGDD